MHDALTLPMMLACGMAVVYGLSPATETPDPLGRSRRVVVRLAGDAVATVALLAVAFLVKLLFVDFDTNSTALEDPSCLLLLVVFSVSVVRLPVLAAVYVSVWGQIVASIMFEFVDLINVGLSGTVRTACRLMLTVAVCAGLLVSCRRWLGPRLRPDGTYAVGRRKLLFAVAVELISLLLSNYQLIFLLLGSRDHSYMVPAFRIMTALLSLTVLYLQSDMEQRQKAQMELGMVQELWNRQRSQYEIAKENVDIINRKCHDMKYQLAALRLRHDDAEIDRQIAQVERSVMIYDATFDTGDPVLDVVLTEKSLYCEEHGITLTCMADGSKLGFIDRTDLYALFGNALDNAVESVMKQTDSERRVIQISVYTKNGFLMIRIRNYCDEPIVFRDGLPVTSKTGEPGYHGYGLRGIRHTAEKYGGTMDIRAGSGSFTLQVLMPLPVG